MTNHILDPSINYYFVCSVQRSGSTLLGTTLARSGIFHSFSAPFNFIELKQWAGERPFLPKDIFPYLNSLLPEKNVKQTTIGFVIEYPQLRNFLDLLLQELGEEKNDLDVLKFVFPKLHFAFLRRHNRVRQAISLVRAMQSKVYAQTIDGKRQIVHAVRYKEASINNALLDIIGNELNWKRFFKENNIIPFELFYEELSSDFSTTATSLLRYWNIHPGIETRIPEPETEIMADHLTEEWLTRYLSESLLVDKYLYSELLQGNFSPLLAKMNIPFERMGVTYWSRRLPNPLWRFAYFCFHPQAFFRHFIDKSEFKV